MKIKRLIWLFAAALFVATSCEENIDTVRNISLSCHTQGLVDGANSQPAIWGVEEQIYLFRSEDWTAALLTQTSGAGSADAIFTGSTAGTKSGYYAIRPASATGSIMPNGTVEVTVAPSNIVIAGEDISTIIPQVGKGNANGVTFTSLFGALKLNISGNYEVSKIRVADLSKAHGLNGTFGYNFLSENLIYDEVLCEVERVFFNPITLAYKPAIYVALPAGQYDKLEISLRDAQSGNTNVYTVKDTAIARNKVTEVKLTSPQVVSFVVGSWHLVKFCGNDAAIDLYMKFTRDNKFEIYQREGELKYSRFTGTYAVDVENSIISGVYSDGEAWADSYKFSLNGENLVFESQSNSAEVSIYEPAEMPSATTQSVSRTVASDVKPL
jgi:hypothetical protein